MRFILVIFLVVLFDGCYITSTSDTLNRGKDLKTTFKYTRQVNSEIFVKLSKNIYSINETDTILVINNSVKPIKFLYNCDFKIEGFQENEWRQVYRIDCRGVNLRMGPVVPGDSARVRYRIKLFDDKDLSAYSDFRFALLGRSLSVEQDEFWVAYSNNFEITN